MLALKNLNYSEYAAWPYTAIFALQKIVSSHTYKTNASVLSFYV